VVHGTRRDARSLRLLRAYALTATVFATVLVLAAFSRFGQKARFGRSTLSVFKRRREDGHAASCDLEQARAPDPVGEREDVPSGRRESGRGLFSSNDEGNENGGLILRGPFAIETVPSTLRGALLIRIQFDQDSGRGDHIRRRERSPAVGFQGGPGGNVPLGELWDRLTASGSSLAPRGPKRFRGSKRSTESTPSWRHACLSDGRSTAPAAIVLSDPQGRPRLRIHVDSSGGTCTRLPRPRMAASRSHSRTRPAGRPPLGSQCPLC